MVDCNSYAIFYLRTSICRARQLIMSSTIHPAELTILKHFVYRVVLRIGECELLNFHLQSFLCCISISSDSWLPLKRKAITEWWCIVSSLLAEILIDFDWTLLTLMRNSVEANKLERKIVTLCCWMWIRACVRMLNNPLNPLHYWSGTRSVSHRGEWYGEKIVRRG